LGIGNWELGIGNLKNFYLFSGLSRVFFEILEDFIPIRFLEENVIIGITFYPAPRSQVVLGNAIFSLIVLLRFFVAFELRA